MMREAIADESMDRREETCEFGCKHKVLLVRTYILAVVEKREVPDLFMAGYGRTGTATGYRAVDQFGTEWLSDWEGSHSDGMYGYRSWDAPHGRRIVRATHDGRPSGAGDGWVEVPFDDRI